MSPTKPGDCSCVYFVTGATGFIGSAVVKELIAPAIKCSASARSDERRRPWPRLAPRSIADRSKTLTACRKGAARSDAVIHLAFNHDFSKFAANCEDRPPRHRGARLGSRGLRPAPDRDLRDRDRQGRARSAATEDDDAISVRTTSPRGFGRGGCPARRGRGQYVRGAPAPGSRPGRQGLITPGSRSPEKRAFAPMSERDATVGPAAHISRCRSPLQAGDRKGGARRESITRSRRKACPSARYCGNHRPAPEAAGQIDQSRRGRGLFWLACPCWPRTTCRPQASRRRRSWDGGRPGLG